MYLNKATIIGNLTRDPELKSLPSGSKVTTFSLATNRYWKDSATGERKEAVEYHNIVVFGRQAETSAQYLKKGQQALIEGRLQTRSWDDQSTGVKKYRTEIVADTVQFGNKVGDGASSSGSGASPSSQDDSLDVIEYPEDDINPEDIPF
ncbi:single-stranded DNA-binding protein [Candidatus Nomurabacteria bacterium]|nr:single-stranded DNA-binding protein [Candidatus Nomurabacteria bacterium]